MDVSKKASVEAAIELTAKFGFLSRKVFWEYLAPKSTASRYRYWQHLLSTGFFESGPSSGWSEEYVYFSSAMHSSGLVAEIQSRRPPVYFAHDEELMRLAIELKARGFIQTYSTEQELRVDRLLSQRLLQSYSYGKIPDLVVDIQTSRRSLRCAIEVEKTRKSLIRYDAAHRNLAMLRGVDLVLFGVASEEIEKSIVRALSSGSARGERKPIGFFDLDDFSKRRLGCALRINDRRISLSEFMENLVGRAGIHAA